MTRCGLQSVTTTGLWQMLLLCVESLECPLVYYTGVCYDSLGKTVILLTD